MSAMHDLELPRVGSRSIEAWRENYDWDDSLIGTCAEIADLVEDQFEAIAERCKRHVLATAAGQRMRVQVDREEYAREGAAFLRDRYRDPLGPAWSRTICDYALTAIGYGVPPSALFGQFAFAHSQILAALLDRLGDDAARFARLSDAVQRIALAEFDLATEHLRAQDAALVRAERTARSAQFRASISESIEGTTMLGNRIRVQAHGASSAARGMLGKTSEVAAAAEQSAVAMREAAMTAA
ncbi:chemotaxis protein, partial [Sphingomonas pokkalii]